MKTFHRRRSVGSWGYSSSFYHLMLAVENLSQHNLRCQKLEFDLPPIKLPIKGKHFEFVTIPPFDYSKIPKN